MKVISSKRCDKENQAIMSVDIYHQWRSVSSNCPSIVPRVLHPAIIYALFGVALARSLGCLVLITFLYPLVNWSCALFGVDKVQNLSKLADGKVGGGNKNYRNKFKNRKLKKCENIATYKLQSAHNLCKLADGRRLVEEGAKNCLTPDQPSRTVNQASSSSKS